EAPLPVEGGDPDPQLRVRGERVDPGLGVECGSDEAGGDHRENDRVGRLADPRLAAAARGTAPPAPVADECEEDEPYHDRSHSDREPLVDREETPVLVARVDHGRFWQYPSPRAAEPR